MHLGKPGEEDPGLNRTLPSILPSQDSRGTEYRRALSEVKEQFGGHRAGEHSDPIAAQPPRGISGQLPSEMMEAAKTHGILPIGAELPELHTLQGSGSDYQGAEWNSAFPRK